MDREIISIFEGIIYMEEKVVVIQIIFFILCFLSGIALIIFILRKNDTGLDYDRIIKEMDQQTEDNLKALEEGNKKIDKIEKRFGIVRRS